MATCNGMPTSSKKQKTTTKKSLLISSKETNQENKGILHWSICKCRLISQVLHSGTSSLKYLLVIKNIGNSGDRDARVICLNLILALISCHNFKN